MNRVRRITLLTLVLTFLLGSTLTFAESLQDTGTVLDSFLEPDYHAKPMTRLWFPDAAAGEDDNDKIEKLILELADKGFGGAEVAMLMSYGVKYTNEESRVYGWGTENWIKLLKKILKAAAKVPGGFQVDMTITGHWPPTLNTIDPNDDAANKELSFSMTPITAEDAADGTNYYYLYNNAFPGNSGMMGNTQGDFYKGDEKALRNVTVTLAGNGVPYQLDPYTGKVSQIDVYTSNDDGTVTFTIDSIFGGTAMIYAVTGNTKAFDAVAEGKAMHIVEYEPVDLGGETWDLVIHSYGPDEDSDDPGVSRITDVDFGAQPLGKWSEIRATEEQLNALGVSDMRYVSGTGEYTVFFNAPANWGDYSGAFITFEYGKDQIGAVAVNGVELTANNASDRVDAGALITEGQNKITVRLNSTLYGRTYAEHSGYQAAGAAYGMPPGFMGPLDPGAYYNGLLGVKIIPYSYLFSPTDRTDTAGGTRTPREPPGRRTGSGEGNTLTRVPNPPAAPVSCVQAAPPAGYEPLTDPAGTVRGVVPLHRTCR